MLEDNSFLMPRRSSCEIVRCKFHPEDGRNIIKHFPEFGILVLVCEACNPPTELARYKIVKEEAHRGIDSRIHTPRFTVPR